MLVHCHDISQVNFLRISDCKGLLDSLEPKEIREGFTLNAYVLELLLNGHAWTSLIASGKGSI